MTRLESIERVKDWTRSRFQLDEDAIVIVTEAVPKLPGYPPLQTSVSFGQGTPTCWGNDQSPKQRHHFTIYKPITDVAEGDIPPAWMKESLALSEGVACSCC